MSREKRRMLVAGLSVLALSVAGTGYAAAVSASADFASAYVFRGETFNDGAVFQPGMEVEAEAIPLTLGVWGNLDLDDYDGAVNDGQFSEVDLYGSYAIPVEGLGLSLGYTEYTYPGSESEADREIALNLEIPDLAVTPALSINYGLDGGIEKSWYLEAALGKEIALNEDLSLELKALVGYLEPDEGEGGFSHYAAVADLSYSVFTAGIAYVGQIDDDVLPDVEDGGAYDVDFYGHIGLAFDL